MSDFDETYTGSSCGSSTCSDDQSYDSDSSSGSNSSRCRSHSCSSSEESTGHDEPDTHAEDIERESIRGEATALLYTLQSEAICIRSSQLNAQLNIKKRGVANTKKSTALVKRIAANALPLDRAPGLCSELRSLNMSRYLAELVVALLDARRSTADTLGVVTTGAALEATYPGFEALLVFGLTSDARAALQAMGHPTVVQRMLPALKAVRKAAESAAVSDSGDVFGGLDDALGLSGGAAAGAEHGGLPELSTIRVAQSTFSDAAAAATRAQWLLLLLCVLSLRCEWLPSGVIGQLLGSLAPQIGLGPPTVQEHASAPVNITAPSVLHKPWRMPASAPPDAAGPPAKQQPAARASAPSPSTAVLAEHGGEDVDASLNMLQALLLTRLDGAEYVPYARQPADGSSSSSSGSPWRPPLATLLTGWLPASARQVLASAPHDVQARAVRWLGTSWYALDQHVRTRVSGAASSSSSRSDEPALSSQLPAVLHAAMRLIVVRVSERQRDYSDLVILRQQADKQLVLRASVSTQLADSLRAKSEASKRSNAMAKQLAEALDVQLPSLISPTVNSQDAGHWASIDTQDSAIAAGPFAEEAARVFYCDLPDLRAEIPSVLLRLGGSPEPEPSAAPARPVPAPTAESAAKAPQRTAANKRMTTKGTLDDALGQFAIRAEPAAPVKAAPSPPAVRSPGSAAGSAPSSSPKLGQPLVPGMQLVDGVMLAKDDEGGEIELEAAIIESHLATSEPTAPEQVVPSLEELHKQRSKELIDAWTLQFVECRDFQNGGAAGLLHAAASLQYKQAHSAAFIARAIATLHRAAPFAQALPAMLLGRCRWLLRNHDKGHAATRTAAGVMLGEATKFGLVPPAVVFSVMQACVGQLSTGSALVLAPLVETCGPFLQRISSTSARMNAVLDAIEQQSKGTHLTPSAVAQLEDCYFLCRPPPVSSAPQQRDPLHDWLEHLMSQVSSGVVPAHQQVPALRKLPWGSTPRLAQQFFSTVLASARVSTSLPAIAQVLRHLQRYQPRVVSHVLHGLTVEVLGAVHVTSQQDVPNATQRHAAARLLAHCVAERILSVQHVLRVLYALLRYGHELPGKVAVEVATRGQLLLWASKAKLPLSTPLPELIKRAPLASLFRRPIQPPAQITRTSSGWGFHPAHPAAAQLPHELHRVRLSLAVMSQLVRCGLPPRKVVVPVATAAQYVLRTLLWTPSAPAVLLQELHELVTGLRGVPSKIRLHFSDRAAADAACCIADAVSCSRSSKSSLPTLSAAQQSQLDAVLQRDAQLSSAAVAAAQARSAAVASAADASGLADDLSDTGSSSCSVVVDEDARLEAAFADLERARPVRRMAAKSAVPSAEMAEVLHSSNRRMQAGQAVLVQRGVDGTMSRVGTAVRVQSRSDGSHSAARHAQQRAQAKAATLHMHAMQE